MNRLRTIALVILAAQNLSLGLWATFAPRSWYDDFPGFGRVWVAVDGPFNEHLVRDIGGLALGLGLMTVAALVTRQELLIRTAGLANLVFGLPHVIYHARHTDLYDASDARAVVAGLVMSVFAAAVTVWPSAPIASTSSPRS